MTISSSQAVETLLSVQQQEHEHEHEEQQQQSRLSPLKVDLPDEQTMQTMWQRSSAVYERLRLQRLCKRIMHVRRREETGMDPVIESPLKMNIGHGVDLSFSKTLGLS